MRRPTSPSAQRDPADNLPERGSAAHQVGARIGKLKILLYNPDNGVTQNFMPHLWMFLLQALTPSGHEVVLIDGNTRPMSDAELVTFAVEERIGLVGIGAMTRMVAKAYRVADAVRAAGIPVVMGGPHVTEVPDEALGRDGGPRHADSVALGEADETWPLIVEDAARGELKEIYTPTDGRECLGSSGVGRWRRRGCLRYEHAGKQTARRISEFNAKVANLIFNRKGTGTRRPHQLSFEVPNVVIADREES